MASTRQTMLFVDAPRPEAGKVFLQGFRLADAEEGIAQAVLRQHGTQHAGGCASQP